MVTKWLQESTETSLLSSQALTISEAFNSPQVSLIKKHNPIELGIKFTKLLMEMPKEINCAWTDETVTDVASSILNQFYMLRFDEFIFAFRHGMAGRYGKVTFAPIQKSDLSQWLTKYMETDRLEAEEMHRSESKKQFQENQVSVEKLVPKEVIAKAALNFDMKARLEKNNERPEITHELIDRRTLAMVQGLYLKKILTDTDLKKFQSDAQKYNWPETLKFCNDEIKARTQTQNTGAGSKV